MYDRPVSGFRVSLSDPARRRQLTGAALLVLAWTALLLRRGIDAGGILDVDTVNFGLAALRYDPLDRQPQPPGYIGYVAFLKLIHALAPGLGPADIAKWGSRISGMLTVPAAYWSCRQILADRPGEVGRPLAAGALAAVHPLLWYYGADGQAHAAEGLVTLLLFGLAVRVRRSPTVARSLLVVAAFGLAGSLRPTISLLSSPLLVWLFWGRPVRDWMLALATGLAAVAVWMIPAVAMTGGWDVYRRANFALFGDMFAANYSALSSRSHPVLVVANICRTLWWGAVALIPLVCARFSGLLRPWGRAWIAIALANLLFYALVYDAEAGYLAAPAALACLLPATRPAPVFRSFRIWLALLACPAFLLFAPRAAPLPDHPGAALPTLAQAVFVQEEQEIYRTAVCGAAAGRRAVVLTDNPSNTLWREVPLLCPDLAIALHIQAMPFEPERVLDVWMIFFSDGIMAVPTGIPLEPGPPARAALPDPVEVVLLSPDASDELANAVLARRTCDPDGAPSPRSRPAVRVLPAACLPVLRIGRHTIDLTASPGGPRFGRF